MDKISCNEIKKLVLSAYKHSKVLKLPIDIISIIKSYDNCRLVTYKEHMEKYNMTYNEIIELMGSKEACTIYDAKTENHLIFYNNLDLNSINTCRYRWSIAHEFGHVMLNHFKSHKLSMINDTLEIDQYELFEKQANKFASFILIPFAILNLYKVKEQSQLKKYCEVSYEAAKHNYVDYLHWKSEDMFKDWYDDELVNFYYEILDEKSNIIKVNEVPEPTMSTVSCENTLNTDVYLKQLGKKYKLMKKVFEKL